MSNPKAVHKGQGFTIIELIIVIVILGVLAVVAAPRFFDFGRDARIATIEQIETALRSAAEMVELQAQLPGRVLQDEGGGNWLDVNRNGVIDSGGGIDQNNPRNNTGTDIRLIGNSRGVLGADNYEVTKLINVSEDLVVQVGERHQTYIGFDRNGDGTVINDLCRVYYSQPLGERASFVGSRTEGC